ncbi:MAG TPA: hypothetical protein VM686_42815 [Polyangiaceae bacterium]|nr:hypothetical protein [Polyangiaceae bacterium]
MGGVAAQAIAYSRLAHATPVAGLVTALADASLYTPFSDRAGASRSVPPAACAPSSARQWPACLLIRFLPRSFPVRHQLREALRKIGGFVLLDEQEFVADVKKLRGAV